MLIQLHKLLLYEMNGEITGKDSLSRLEVLQPPVNLEDPENQRKTLSA